MGANHSAGRSRSVNIKNDNPVGVIDVSDQVVQRLKNGLAKDKLKQIPEVEPTNINQAPQTNPYNKHDIGYKEKSISAVQIQREKEIELQQNDLYWQNRLLQLEKNLNKTNQIMEKEYSEALENVQKRFTNVAPIYQLPPCQDLKSQLTECYKQNPNECLKCSSKVKAFSNCVNKNRIFKLEEKLNEPTAIKNAA